MDLHPNNHHHHHLQQQQQATPPLPPPLHKPLPDHDLKRRPLVPLSSFSNGTLKKHRPLYPPPPPPHNHAAYRECMKNHAASLGGHALDGCGEFMPSPDATPADPASLTCAACGCHRNFHRRLLHLAIDHPHRHHPPPHREDREVLDDGAADDDDGDEAPDDDDDDDEDAPRGSPPPPAPTAAHQYYSAPHMLMALSAGIPGGPPGPTGSSPEAAVAAATTQVAGATNLAALPRKRFRSKFSPLQKERMQELSERLGWRMQRRDEALVEERCREIGVSRGVFKVWMHNNKHNFVSGPSSRRAAGGAVGGGGGGGGEGTSNNGGIIDGGGGIAAGVNGIGERNGPGDEQNGGGGGVGGGLVLNSSSSPSS